jgi:hypothetical protein
VVAMFLVLRAQGYDQGVILTPCWVVMRNVDGLNPPDDHLGGEVTGRKAYSSIIYFLTQPFLNLRRQQVQDGRYLWRV